VTSPGLPKPKTAVIHFGCRLNQFESDGIRANLTQHSHQLIQDQREADYIVINTCTVTNKADYKNRAAIRRAHRLNPQAKIVVTGCYATTDAGEIQSLPGVYRVVSNDKKHQIGALLAGNAETPDINRFFFSADHELKSRATLKIQDGCNKSCSYCKIPQARGPGVSRNFENTLDSARRLIDSGFGEIVLTGVNIGWYVDAGKTFHDLVESILALPGNFHLRISSIEPGDVDQRFAEFYQHEKMANFLHIPLQSGSKYVLRMMRRGYTPDMFARRVEAVRKVNADTHIGTDIIVGFPSEGEPEFAETLALCRDLNFANIHIFPFSKRRNTPIVDWINRRASKHADTPAADSASKSRPGLSFTEVNGLVIRERARELSELKAEMGHQYTARMEGKPLNAIAERVEEGSIHFVTENYLRGEMDSEEFATPVKRGSRFSLVWRQDFAAARRRTYS
jgi:threonylcarbamoyladenosine tRNA methylthiotransferase MtaB